MEDLDYEDYEDSMFLSFGTNLSHVKKNGDSTLFKEKVASTIEVQVIGVLNMERDPMIEFDSWLFSPYYPRGLRLLGGNEDNEEEITLSMECTSQCKLILRAGYAVKEQALALKKLLINEGIISETTTHNDFVKNKKLLKAIKLSLISGLETNPKKSRFGATLISDFELCYYLQSEIAFNERMIELNVLNGSDEWEILRRNRRNIMTFIRKILSFVIDSLELSNTPKKIPKKRASSKEALKKSLDEIKSIGKRKRQKKKEEKQNSENEEQSLTDKMEQNLQVVDQKMNAEEQNQSDEMEQNFQVVDYKMDAEENQKDNSESEEEQQQNSSSKKTKFLGRRSFTHKIFTDEYTTPFAFINVLHNLFLKQIPDATKSLKIWECCCGSKQNIVKNLKAKGYTVYYSDINDNDGNNEIINFLDDDLVLVNDEVNFIITNPPWSQNKFFFKQVLKMNLSFAFLVKIDVIGTKYFQAFSKSNRYNLFVLPITNSLPFFNEETQKNVQVGKVCWIIGLINEDLTIESQIKVLYEKREDLNFILDSNDNVEDSEIIESIHKLWL